MTEQIVVITGAGRGLGRELVRTFARSGALVVGLSRSRESLAELAEEFADTSFVSVCADVKDPQAVTAAFDEIVATHGRLDVLFNNAAVYPKVSYLEESAEEWLEAVLTNLGGVSNCCKAALPHMIKQGKGRIINVGSWADRDPIAASSAYSASKGGLHALTKSIAKDLEPLGLDIEVHEWMPGILNTRMSDFTGIDPAVAAQWGKEIVDMKATSKCSVFENNREWFPPKGLRERLMDAIFFWK